MTTYYTHTYSAPCGPLFCIVDEAGAVVAIDFAATGSAERSRRQRFEARGIRLVPDAERTAPLVQQLEEYFAGKRHEFDLRLAPLGTPFQQQVWQALTRIPYGETRSYGEIAREIGWPNASRAVGAANGANPIPIVVPCHRVIGANGSLTGFGGGLDVKKALLDLESAPRKAKPQQLSIPLGG
ncbi:MAG TPA: methylated-DNA--[protein]-cysteine S-methyltransferase [Thermoanaerobaculia bacterium]|nr:methylated-DNA--[protein]-cysteine S-methyltransferase [Thermoanaerobaculia bacterium]